jgi:hypothetical protein
MKLLTLLLTLAVTISIVNAAELKSDEWKTKLESVIHQYDTTGNVIVENGTYVYRYHTQIYKVHPIISKLGDVAEKAIDQEGPKIDGILLHATIRNGDIHLDQLVMPQVIQEPYWNTFINSYPIDTNKYFRVLISYGCRSNRKFIEDIEDNFPTKIPRFGLYLVNKDAKELDQIEFAHLPIFTDTDILNYNWTNHTITISETAIKRIPGNSYSLGRPFVIVVDGKPAYRGSFRNSKNAFAIAEPIILIDVNSTFNVLNNTIQIYNGFPGFIQYPNKNNKKTSHDPRDNQAVKKVLQELGKFVE